MLKTTHINFGMFIYGVFQIIVYNYLGYFFILAFILLPFLLVLPDIDTKDGIIVNKIYGFQYIYNFLEKKNIKHRTITHQLVGVFILSIFVYIFFNILFLGKFLNIYEFVGIFMLIYFHILGDYLTKGNLSFLYPLNKKSIVLGNLNKKLNNFRNKYLMRTGSEFEKKEFSLLFLILNIMLLVYINYYGLYKEYAKTIVEKLNSFEIGLLFLINFLLLVSLFSIDNKKIKWIRKMMYDLLKFVLLILLLNIIFYFFSNFIFDIDNISLYIYFILNLIYIFVSYLIILSKHKLEYFTFIVFNIYLLLFYANMLLYIIFLNYN